MHKEQRLTRKQDFAAVLSQRKAWANSLLVLKAWPNSLSVSRFGFSISRKVGTAVTRNRVRRRLREIIRQTPIKSGWDVVIITRSPVAEADFHRLREALIDLLRRAQLLGDGSGLPEGSREK